MLTATQNTKISNSALPPITKTEFAANMLEAFDENLNGKLDRDEMAFSSFMVDEYGIEKFLENAVLDQKKLVENDKTLDKPELLVRTSLFDTINAGIAKPNYEVDANGAFGILPVVEINYLLQTSKIRFDILNLEVLPSDNAQYCKGADKNNDGAFDKKELEDLYDCFFEKTKPTTMNAAVQELFLFSTYANIVKYGVTKAMDYLHKNPPYIYKSLEPRDAAISAGNELSEKVKNDKEIGSGTLISYLSGLLANYRYNFRYIGEFEKVE